MFGFLVACGEYMSKLIEELEKVGTVQPTRMGFGVARPEEKSPNLLIVGIIESVTSKKISNSHLKHFVVCSDSLGPVQDFGDSILGVWPDKINAETIDSLASGCADFIIIPSIETTSEIVSLEETSKFIVLTDLIPEDIYRSVEELPFDGIVLCGLENKQPISIRDLMWIRSIRDVTSKPILLSITKAMTYQELSIIRDVGMQGILLDLKTVKEKDLKSMAEHIKSMPVKKVTKESMSAILPRASLAGSEAVPDELEDDEFD